MKSRIQSVPVSEKQANYKVWQGLKDIYRNEGIQALFRGVGICSLRAYPVNAVTFFVYEKIKEILG